MKPTGRSRLAALAAVVTHTSGRLTMVLLIPLVLLGLLGPWLIPFDPLEVAAGPPLAPPGAPHWFGTDQLGRDQLARVAAAIPVAFLIPIVSVAFAVIGGGLLGVVAGYRGGATERVLMAITDILLAVPALLMAILIVAVFGGGPVNTTLAISLIYVPRFARIARAPTLSIRRMPYVDAARLAGTRPVKLVARHVVPGLVPPMVVMAALSLSTALLAQAGLSFLGLGIAPPAPDLGSMLAASTNFMLLSPWLAIFPGLVVVALVLGFNLLADAIQDVVDPGVSRARTIAVQ